MNILNINSQLKSSGYQTIYLNDQTIYFELLIINGEIMHLLKSTLGEHQYKH